MTLQLPRQLFCHVTVNLRLRLPAALLGAAEATGSGAQDAPFNS